MDLKRTVADAHGRAPSGSLRQTTRTESVSSEVEDFLASCRARGLSPKTVRESYGYPLRSILVPWCEREGFDSAAHLGRRELDRLSIELLGRPGRRPGQTISPYSVKSYLKAVSQFLGWWQTENRAPSVRPQLPRTRKRARDVLSRDQIDAMEAATDSERDRLLIRILGDTGAREGEVVNLRLDDLIARGRRSFLRFEGKTGQRLTAIEPGLHRRLTEYVQRNRPRDVPGDQLFWSLRRRGSAYEPLRERGLYQMIVAAGERIDVKAYPHIFRHSLITHMLARGHSQILIAEQLGVSPAVIASNYAHVSLEDQHDAWIKGLR